MHYVTEYSEDRLITIYEVCLSVHVCTYLETYELVHCDLRVLMHVYVLSSFSYSDHLCLVREILTLTPFVVITQM